MNTISLKSIIIGSMGGGIALILILQALVGHAFSASPAAAESFPKKAIEIATEIQAKSDRVAAIDKELEALQIEKTKTTASAHAQDIVLCTDFGLTFKRVGSGAVVDTGLTKGECSFQ